MRQPRAEPTSCPRRAPTPRPVRAERREHRRLVRRKQRLLQPGRLVHRALNTHGPDVRDEPLRRLRQARTFERALWALRNAFTTPPSPSQATRTARPAHVHLGCARSSHGGGLAEARAAWPAARSWLAAPRCRMGGWRAGTARPRIKSSTLGHTSTRRRPTATSSRPTRAMASHE